MSINIRFKLVGIILASALFCSACQSLMPKAQGLVSPTWQAQDYQRQDQIEVQWKERSFSFLLYQQQQGQNLQMVALSLTGQQLFQLTFDGQKVTVEQRIEQMKLLPFDFVVRDILYATYPHFIGMQQEHVEIEQTDQKRMVKIKGQTVLEIAHQNELTELMNIQVPYQMTISPVTNTLENAEEQDVQ